MAKILDGKMLSAKIKEDIRLETEELKKLQAQSEYYEKINELANILYNRSDYQWDCLYEKAEEIVNDYMEGLLNSLE